MVWCLFLSSDFVAYCAGYGVFFIVPSNLPKYDNLHGYWVNYMKFVWHTWKLNDVDKHILESENLISLLLPSHNDM